MESLPPDRGAAVFMHQCVALARRWKNRKRCGECVPRFRAGRRGMTSPELETLAP